VGSCTVARTKRIDIDRRAESAVIAWLRHQTTAYDSMKIARVKGRRREVRRELAQVSRALLDLHRQEQPHVREACSLCRALPA
jgi:16S rRNA U516 pseudouridylate synthase RsuA-like enzyme